MRALALAFALVVPAFSAAAAEQNDLREFRVGMPVSALPATGYAAFQCANDPGKALSGWNDWQACPPLPGGVHAVAFRYADAAGDKQPGKTLVAGQAVTLALLIDDRATVAGIKIDTDPHAPLYLHKKAFLFALQVRARFGEDGWTCQQQQPTPDQQPIGGVFIHEHCEKLTPSRRFVLDRELFHNPAESLRDFTGGTQVTIERPG